LVEPGNPSALAEGVLRLLENPAEAKAMGEAAQLKMRNGFSAENMVEEIEGLYKELLGTVPAAYVKREA
jgi:glycosyltransferase involved in cell wall biosynthesis